MRARGRLPGEGAPTRRGDSGPLGPDPLHISASGERRRAPSPRLVLAPDQRAFITGRSGSGKTYLATHWIREWRSGIAIDPKHMLGRRDLPGWQLVLGFDAALRAWGPEHPRLIVRPVPGDYRPGAGYDRLAERVLATSRPGAGVGWYDDEVLNAAPLGRITAGLERLLGEGRGLWIPVVIGTQRPIGVHNKVLSEANHLVIFTLTLDGDRRKLASFAGDQLLDPQLLTARHSWAHYDADTGQLTIHAPLPG